jgi:hypothetical protein
MNFVTFLLLVLTFPYWFPVVAPPSIAIGLIWMVGYPIACTLHCLYMRLRTGRWGYWQLLYPGQ